MCVFESERDRDRDKDRETDIHCTHAEVKVCLLIPFYCGFCESNSGTQACIACLLLTEFSPQPLVELFTIDNAEHLIDAKNKSDS